MLCNLAQPGGPKAGVSNERFSAKSSFDANLTSTPRFIRHPFTSVRESRITVFPGGNIKISNVLKISPRLRAVPLGLRYQGIGSSINFSVFFHQSGRARAGAKKL